MLPARARLIRAFDSFSLEMKTSLTLIFSILFVAQCGVPTQQSLPQDKQPSTETQNKRCDFSSYKPLRLGAAGLGTPVLSLPQPEYSAEARERKLAGRITVTILINIHTGFVEQACAPDGDEILKQLVEAAALKIRLSPYNDYIKLRYRYAQGAVVYNFVSS
jgi:hypothetical protein